MVISDNGTEFTSNAILGWAEEQRIAWHYIAPGKPMQNGFILEQKLFPKNNDAEPATVHLGADHTQRLNCVSRFSRESLRSRDSACPTLQRVTTKHTPAS